MRFLGFFQIMEWDGTTSVVSASEERADLYDYLKLGVDFWVHIVYGDHTVHKVDKRYFDAIKLGHHDTNVYATGVPR